MRAYVLQRYGGAECAALTDIPAPRPGPHELLVDVRAAGLNPVDVKIRAAGHDFGSIRYSDRPGWDVAGTVVGVGPDVTGWREGAAV